ncbi:DUF1648 domain-containing protein [Longimicrobium sp.]|uniref:DUF1648 domain-containing protein n=1 Tax=Longimicrobium sp. TaxID=2029185 RepID=UPI002E32ECCB|nr:DUF1648 domain-containing protein [Longimicrobium sp.]HEX6041894.1 DUF1648 domain-containing protein [Longimicrobium sp.]
MSATARYRLLNAVLLAALLAGSAWAYPRLPGRIPMHFNAAGQVDRWEGRSPASWFMLPILAAVLAVFMWGIGIIGERHPHTWNVPDKPRFLALSPEARAPIMARMGEFLAFVSLMCTALMSALQLTLYDTATSRETQMPAWMMGFVGAFLIVVLIAGVRLNVAVGRMIRDASASARD